jgi:N-acetylglucosaminyldiphosphoundecaprenol N-acetyl-beta-D-mannosaminyltransferase
MDRASNLGLRLFLLGARDEVVSRAAERIAGTYKGAPVVGCHSGYFCSEEETDIVSSIRNSRPHILLVGRGFPRQEEFALKYLDHLDSPLIWCVGGLFDFISGKVPRAPSWMRSSRLEWLFRLLIEPRRKWHRNFIASPWFMAKVAGARLRGVREQPRRNSRGKSDSD